LSAASKNKIDYSGRARECVKAGIVRVVAPNPR
jgi:hypothetical protein